VPAMRSRRRVSMNGDLAPFVGSWPRCYRVRVGDAGAERTGVIRREDRRGDRHERESCDQRGPDEASAQRSGTRAAGTHLIPTEVAAAFGDISEPGGMSSPHARGTDAASDDCHPRAFMETAGTSPRE